MPDNDEHDILRELFEDEEVTSDDPTDEVRLPTEPVPFQDELDRMDGVLNDPASIPASRIRAWLAGGERDSIARAWAAGRVFHTLRSVYRRERQSFKTYLDGIGVPRSTAYLWIQVFEASVQRVGHDRHPPEEWVGMSLRAVIRDEVKEANGNGGRSSGPTPLSQRVARWAERVAPIAAQEDPHLPDVQAVLDEAQAIQIAVVGLIADLQQVLAFPRHQRW